ncbi:MAG: hypothetical protein HY900_21880, partial [Deltaproteobacteria bacterium]|nr:hypothetical protein [Deltaproteobacteria bacterium]
VDSDTQDFGPAAAALAAAREGSVPVILCSSKTCCETLAWQERLRLTGPFIAERGGAVFHAGDGPLGPHFPDQIDGLPAKVFGTPYAVLRRSLEELRRDFGLPIRGFGDMELEEIVRVAGLAPEDAAAAKRRDFGEPFVWDAHPDEERLERVRPWLSERRLQMLRGERLWHLVGGNDVGSAIRWLVSICADVYGSRLPSLGLGDNQDDLLMLHAVDKGCLVEQPGGGHVDGAHPEIARVPGIGPQGWVRAVEEWLGTAAADVSSWSPVHGRS